ncbi:MAG: hypothetical protein V1790_01565, partial [Planctomycetota bacterium]
MKANRLGRLVVVVAILGGVSSARAAPLGTEFMYQGQLKEGGAPLDGTADFQFTLWDSAGSGNPPTGGTQVGVVQAINALPVTAGLFSVTLNGANEFGGNAFNGNARWLQIAVRSPAGGGGFTTLAPRQPLTATPHTLFALNADRLDGLDSTAFLQSVPNPLTLSGTNATHIIRGENASTTSGAAGILGMANAATGTTSGVYGESVSTSGRAVYPHFSPSVASRCWLSRKQRLVAGCVGNAAGGGRLRRVRRSGGGGKCPLWSSKTPIGADRVRGSLSTCTLQRLRESPAHSAPQGNRANTDQVLIDPLE